MPAPRKPENRQLPLNVTKKKGRFVLTISRRPYKEITLCPGNVNIGLVWAAYDEYKSDGSDTLSALISAYLGSHEFKLLKPNTQHSYEINLQKARDWEMPRFKRPFGTLKLIEIGNKTIQSWYDQQDPNVARNRRAQCLKIAFSWGMQRFHGVEKNPVVGLKLLKERPRTRYVEDSEYKFVYDHANTMTQLLMEGAYILRGRRNEIASLHRIDNILENGVLIERGKGSWDGVVEWSPRLRKWVRDCGQFNKDRFSRWLIHNAKGSAITKSALRMAWVRLWDKISDIEGCPEYFTFHDLKAKGVTDHPDKEGGHKSPKMRAVYDRKHRMEKPTK